MTNACPELGVQIDLGTVRRMSYLIGRYPNLAEFRAMLEGWSESVPGTAGISHDAGQGEGELSSRFGSARAMWPSSSPRRNGKPCASCFSARG